MVNEQTFTKIKIKEVDVYKEGDGFYLKVIYGVNSDTETFDVVIPKILLPINEDEISITTDSPHHIYTKDMYIHNLFTENTFLLFRSNLDGVCSEYFIRNRKPKEKIMTISEIEKELGYKIKIVNEENVPEWLL